MGMRAPVNTPPELEPIDWRAAKDAILAGLNIESEYAQLGVKFARASASPKGWRECYAMGREDTVASAAINNRNGIYKDSGGDGLILPFFDFAMRFGQFGRWIDCMRHYADRAGVTLGKIKSGGEGKIREAEYLYRDAGGEIRYAVFRFRHPSGKKTFSQQASDGKGGWKGGPGCMDGVEPLPYRLPELLAEPDAPVWIVEGEKDADRLAALGLVATTNHQGAGSTDTTWPKFLRHFIGRDCFVIPDNDANGRTHARKVATYLASFARSVKVVTLAGLPAKGDVSDWLDLGHTAEDLVELAGVARPFDVDEPAPEEPKSDPEGGFVNCGNSVHEDNEEEAAPEEWPDPELGDSVEAEPFPLDVFPESLASLCRDASEAMQCPVDYFAGPALALAGIAIGRSVSLSVTSTWKESPNLFLAIVGPPGSKKSQALKLMSGALFGIDSDLRDEYIDAMLTYQQEAAEAKGSGATIPPPPTPRQLTLDDATREAIAQVHSENHRGLAVIKDELSAWVASLNAYRQGKGDDKQFFMSLFTGSLVKVNRKGNPLPLLIPRPCVSVIGALTPSSLPAMKAGQADDGWLDRILFCYPDPVQVSGWSEAHVKDALIADWNEAVNRLWNRPMVVEETKRRPYFVEFDEAAKALWVKWYNEHHAEQAGHDFPRALLGPWSKLEAITLRLALILGQIHQAYDPDDKPSIERPSDDLDPKKRPRPRNLESLDMVGAAKLAAYFKSHFRKARAELTGRSAETPHEVARVLRWIQHHNHESFSGRDLLRAFPLSMDEDDRERVIRWLVSRNCIRPRPVPPEAARKPGRPHSTVYDVNPKLIFQ